MGGVEVEGDRVVEPEIVGVDSIALDHAQTERDGAPVLPPHEEAGLVGHAPPDLAEIGFCKRLETHLRATVDLQIQRIELVDDGRDVGANFELDRRRVLRGAKFQPKIPACLAAQRALQIVFETRVIDIEPRHRQAGNSRKSPSRETLQPAAIFRREFLEHDQRPPGPPPPAASPPPPPPAPAPPPATLLPPP